MQPIFSKTEERALAIGAGIILITLLVLNHLFSIAHPANILSSFTYYLSTSIGAILAIQGAIRIGTKNFIGRGLAFWGVSLVFSLLGYITWDYYEFIVGIELPYPSFADAMWTFATLLALIGVFFVLTIYRLHFSKRIVFESIGVLAVLLALTAYFIGIPDFSEATFSTGLFDTIYTVTDAIWLTLTYVILRLAGGRIFKGLTLYTGGIVFLAAGDIAFAIRVANETYFTGDVADVLLSLGYLLMAAGIYFTAKSFSGNRPAVVAHE